MAKLDGADKLVKDLKKTASLSDVKKIVRANTAALQNGSQRKAPNRSGELESSIEMEITDGGLTGWVSPGKNYAPYVEYGTRFMQARPFLRPTFQQVSEKFKRDLKGMIK